jgi:F0F1-type ATP synthase epsilon subunit
MANPEQKTFHCDLIDPTGKLLDCEASSVVLPAHDGQLGILYVMKVTTVPTAPPKESPRGDLFFFVDGGSALVAQNTVTVIAYSALNLQDTQTGQIESLIDKTAQNAANPALPAVERAHETERLRALQKLAESRKGQ